MNEPSVIVLELNELTPPVMTRWINDGKLPGFKRLLEESTAYVTDAEEPQETLEPWIQWVTVHSGLKYKEHGIYDLGDGHKLRAPRIWDVLSEAGKRVWVCGSMNTGARTDRINGAILPDPWSVGLKPHPQGAFDDFYHFVQTSVQEYTSPQAPLGLADYMRFGGFMVKNGLTAKTVKQAVSQLISERTGKYHWRRAMILDRFIWDVFRSYWRQNRPHYATVFLNSCAHLQHHYWRNMEPDAFEIKPSAREQAEYHDAVLRGYQAMDDIIQEALELIQGTNTSLVMMSALGQQPLTAYDKNGGKQMYKPKDPQALLAFAGITAPASFAPVMAEDFRFLFETEQAAKDAQERFDALSCAKKPLMKSRRDGSELYLGCAIIQDPGQYATVLTERSTQSKPFADLFYPMLGIKSGRHHPDGLFWVRAPGVRASQVADRVPLSRTTATIARLAGLDEKSIRKHFLYPGLLPAELAPKDERQNSLVLKEEQTAASKY